VEKKEPKKQPERNLNDLLVIQVTARRDFVPIESFLKVVSNTVRMLNNIDLDTSPSHRRTTRWKIVGASLKSPLTLSLNGQAKHHERVAEVAKVYLDGMGTMERDPNSIPAHFSLDTLQKAKKLVSVLDDGISRVVFSGYERSVSPTQKVAASVDALTAASYSSYGSVDGILETLTAHGGLQFVIYDRLSGDEIDCRFNSVYIEDARAAWTHRVRVYGAITYSRAGIPKSINVDGAPQRLKDRSVLPQAKDLEGIDVTAGVESAEYVRRLRDTER